MPTYTPKASEIERAWHVVDADGLVLGRMATEVARVLRGKHKTMFAPHLDTGDHVVIVNAKKVVLTSGKADKERVWRHIERRFGRFERSLRVPGGLNPDAVDASMADGVLTMAIPRPEQPKPHRVRIHPGSGQQRAVEGTASEGTASEGTATSGAHDGGATEAGNAQSATTAA